MLVEQLAFDIERFGGEVLLVFPRHRSIGNFEITKIVNILKLSKYTFVQIWFVSNRRTERSLKLRSNVKSSFGFALNTLFIILMVGSY